MLRVRSIHEYSVLEWTPSHDFLGHLAQGGFLARLFDLFGHLDNISAKELPHLQVVVQRLSLTVVVLVGADHDLVGNCVQHAEQLLLLELVDFAEQKQLDLSLYLDVEDEF